ncbi:NAD-dependent protein deacetylase sirtuin-2 [Rhizoclosmatium sp. JEL0117]|nr:NAD-dependent protein deacetylase sirtuin-2 [Rhizoclosmatium sp. JEL0117]
MELTVSFGNEDEGFAVYPKTDCPHAKNGGIQRLGSKELQAIARLATTNTCNTANCATESIENWLCLKCNFVGCSRYQSSHLLNHNSETAHPIAASFTDLSVFCYECEDYIQVREMIPVVDALHWGKFGERHPMAKVHLGQPAGGSSSSSYAPLELLDVEEEGEEEEGAEESDGNKDVEEPATSNRVLRDSSIEAFAEYIKSNKCKKIMVLTGAGISTSAGIPDFRTPGSGLYDNLQKYNLPTPQAVFDINYFRVNPKPFFLLAKELYPGNFNPTPSHYFIKLLAEQNLLLRNFTQNIDTLERVAGISPEYLVEAHGSFGAASCVGHFAKSILDKTDGNEDDGANPADDVPETWIKSCGRVFTQEWVKERVFANVIPRCPDCNGLVKPDIVFFGEALPDRFRECLADFSDADALIVMGSSLIVTPFALLPDFVGGSIPRLLINREVAGNFLEDDENGRDSVFLGDCDAGCAKLAELLGLEKEFEKLVFDSEKESSEGNKAEAEVEAGIANLRI